MTPYTKPEDVAKHADAMAAISEALKPFPATEQMVMVAGILGNVLVRCVSSKTKAIMLMGTAMDMTRDMIQRNYDDKAERDRR